MKKILARAAIGASATLLVFALSVPANASCIYTLCDNYSGGTNNYPSPNADVDSIEGGTNIFEIAGVNASRNGSNQLVIDIVTHFAFAGPPPSFADGTNYGSLFLTTSAWAPVGGQNDPNHNKTDTFATSGTTWQYAATNSGLYAIGGPLTSNASSQNASVPVSFSNAAGTVVMSNVGGNPVSQPYSGAPGFFFRQGQAVTYNPTNSSATVQTNTDGLGNVTVVPSGNATGVTVNITPASFTGSTATTFGVIEYVITDNGLLGDDFALSWAMTCANDVIQGIIQIPPGNTTTPLPATALLMGSVLGAGGFMARWRRRKSKADMAA